MLVINAKGKNKRRKDRKYVFGDRRQGRSQ